MQLAYMHSKQRTCNICTSTTTKQNVAACYTIYHFTTNTWSSDTACNAKNIFYILGQ